MNSVLRESVPDPGTAKAVAAYAALAGASSARIKATIKYDRLDKEYASRHKITSNKYSLRDDYDPGSSYNADQYRKQYLEAMNELINGR